MKKKFEASEAIITITAVLAYGAMVLSPHFPDRSAFGIMVLNIILIARLLTQIAEIYEVFHRYARLFYASTLAYSILLLLLRVI